MKRGYVIAVLALMMASPAWAGGTNQVWIDGYCHWKVPDDPNWAGEAPGSNWRCLEAYAGRCHYTGHVATSSGQSRPAAIVCGHAKPIQLED